MPWYNRVLCATNTAIPFLVPTQATNLALLVSAILKKRTLCLSELARASPLAGAGPRRWLKGGGERHKLGAGPCWRTSEHTALLSASIFASRVGGYASGCCPP
jgi:hypothetical protein